MGLSRTTPVRVERTLPFGPESLRAICAPPSMPLEDCPTCRAIASPVSRFEKGGGVESDDIPAAVGALRPWLCLGEQIRTLWIDRCPTCLRIYLEEESYEFLVGGSEDSHSYARIDVEAVLGLPELTWTKPPAELQFDGECWYVVEVR